MRKIIAIALGLCASIVLIAMQQSPKSKSDEKAKKAELAMGKKLYEKHACNSCHGNDGIGQSDLRQAYKNYTDEQLKSYIKNPRTFANYQMPVYKEVIVDADYKALIAYVKWLGEKSNAKKK